MANLEVMMILTVAVGSAVVVVVIIVWIGCVYNDRTRNKVDHKTPKKIKIDEPNIAFPERLETLNAYFEEHESTESSTFVTKVRTQEKDLKKENKQNHKTVQNNQDDRSEITEEKEIGHENGKGVPEIELTSDNEMRSDVHSTSKAERENNFGDNIIDSNKRTEQADIKPGIHSYAGGVLTDENEIVSASDENSNSDITSSSEIYELINTDSNETDIVPMEITQVNAIIADADIRKECESQDGERGSKLRFLESILMTNSTEDLRKHRQTTESRKKGKKLRKGMQLKQFRIGLFHYYYYQGKNPLKKFKGKKSPKLSSPITNEHIQRTPSPTRTHIVSQQRSDSRIDQNTAEQQTKKRYLVMEEAKCSKKSKTTSLASSTSKINTQMESGRLSKNSLSRYDSSASCFTISLS